MTFNKSDFINAAESGSSQFQNPKGSHGVGFVYFIRCGRHIKIGRAANVAKRLSAIQQGLPDEAAILHYIITNDAACLEMCFHRMFERFRSRGEWFAFDKSHIEAIRPIERVMFEINSEQVHHVSRVIDCNNSSKFKADQCSKCGKLIAVDGTTNPMCCECRYGDSSVLSCGDGAGADCHTYMTTPALEARRINAGYVLGRSDSDGDTETEWL